MQRGQFWIAECVFFQLDTSNACFCYNPLYPVINSSLLIILATSHKLLNILTIQYRVIYKVDAVLEVCAFIPSTSTPGPILLAILA